MHPFSQNAFVVIIIIQTTQILVTQPVHYHGDEHAINIFIPTQQQNAGNATKSYK